MPLDIFEDRHPKLILAIFFAPPMSWDTEAELLRKQAAKRHRMQALVAKSK